MVSPNKPVQPQSPSGASPASDRADVRERRRSKRIETLTAGKLTPPGKNKPERRIQVFDVSLHGVGFRATSALAIGDVFDVEIGNGPLYLSGTIRITRSRPRKDGTFDTGADFI
jgi:hypothetical protein